MSENRTFLIVDDEPEMCWIIEQVLISGGFAVRKALSAGEALDLVAADSFHGILLDAKLPDMEGMELARRIKAMAPTTPLVMVSGYFYRDDVAIREALHEGLISGFVAKPFDRRDILREIEGSSRPSCDLPDP
jgi:CheY-like chemotaxis protein